MHYLKGFVVDDGEDASSVTGSTRMINHFTTLFKDAEAELQADSEGLYDFLQHLEGRAQSRMRTEQIGRYDPQALCYTDQRVFDEIVAHKSMWMVQTIVRVNLLILAIV